MRGEIKTINHRYLDLNIRMPRQYSFLEEKIRKIIPNFISRGKIDINVNINELKRRKDLGKRRYDEVGVLG